MNRRTTPREHGTRARYVFGAFGSERTNGCRCQPCKDANCAYARFEQKRVRLNRDTGTFARPMVTTARAFAHIETLRAEGIGYRHIAGRVLDGRQWTQYPTDHRMEGATT